MLSCSETECTVIQTNTVLEKTKYPGLSSDDSQPKT